MEVAKDFLSPEVNAAFAGITVREFDDGDSLGPEKKEKGDAPEPDRHPAVGGNGWDHIQIENGDDEKQDEVPAAEHALETRSFGGCDGGVWYDNLASQ